MAKLTACRECKWFRRCSTCGKVYCSSPGVRERGGTFDWYNGDYTTFWTEFHTPERINTDGHCKFFEQKDE